MNKIKLLFKFPTRTRPEKFFSCIDRVYDKLNNREDYLIAVTADKDDPTMFNKSVLTQIKNRIKLGYKINIQFGLSKHKIHAVNRDMEIYKDWDVAIVLSDDMDCSVKGFDDIIRANFKKLYPDFDGCLHFDDGYTKDQLCTMIIIGRKYYQRFNYFYHPSYSSLCSDREYTEVAKKNKKIFYFPQILFVHNHPANIGGYVDNLLKYNDSFFNQDCENYNKRKKNNFKN